MSLRTSAGIARVHHLCKAFDLSRAALYKAASADEKPEPPPRKPRAVTTDAHLLTEIRSITTDHPALGHRKVWAILRRREMLVARRRIWKLMHDAGLTFEPSARRCEPRRGTIVVPEPNRRWSSDMTTVFTRNDGWVALTPVIDNGCRTLFEIGVTKSQEASALLAPIERALLAAFGEPNAVPADFELRTDHGSVYTGADCEELSNVWRVEHTFSPVGRPTGNAVAERIIQTMKMEVLWLQDWEDLAEVQAALEPWRIFYNTERPHESLGWRTPAEQRAARLKDVRPPNPAPQETPNENVGDSGANASGAESPENDQDRALPAAA